MDSEKIGNLISKLRKEKDLTQTEFAKRIGVSNKTVSKWENGRGIPDWGVFENICKELNITLSELLNGELDVKDEGVVNEYMKYKRKQQKKNIMVFGILFILIILVLILGFYFLNNYNKVNFYEITSNSEKFSYKGYFLKSSSSTAVISNIFNSDVIDMDDVITSELAVKIDDDYYGLGVGGNSTQVQDYGYNEVFHEDLLEYVPDDLYLIVSYYEDDTVKNEIIKLDINVIATSSKMFYKKSEDISAKPQGYEDRKIDLHKYDRNAEYIKQLKNNGFKEERGKNNYCYNDKLIRFCINLKHWNVSGYADFDGNSLYFTEFVYDDFEYYSISVYGTGASSRKCHFSKNYETGEGGISLEDKDCQNLIPYVERFEEFLEKYRYKDE